MSFVATEVFDSHLRFFRLKGFSWSSDCDLDGCCDEEWFAALLTSAVVAKAAAAPPLAILRETTLWPAMLLCFVLFYLARGTK